MLLLKTVVDVVPRGIRRRPLDSCCLIKVLSCLEVELLVRQLVVLLAHDASLRQLIRGGHGTSIILAPLARVTSPRAGDAIASVLEQTLRLDAGSGRTRQALFHLERTFLVARRLQTTQ